MTGRASNQRPGVEKLQSSGELTQMIKKLSLGCGLPKMLLGWQAGQQSKHASKQAKQCKAKKQGWQGKAGGRGMPNHPILHTLLPLCLMPSWAEKFECINASPHRGGMSVLDAAGAGCPWTAENQKKRGKKCTKKIEKTKKRPSWPPRLHVLANT